MTLIEKIQATSNSNSFPFCAWLVLWWWPG